MGNNNPTNTELDAVVAGLEDDDAVDSRVARTATTRDADERPESWKPAARLPEPDKQPGYEYRWIRVSSMGKADANNAASKFREGWESVAIEEQPQFDAFRDPDSRYKNGVEIAGLLLCKIPTEIVERRKRYFSSRNQEQMESVDKNFMRQNDPRMPLFSERSSRGFGKGN